MTENNGHPQYFEFWTSDMTQMDIERLKSVYPENIPDECQTIEDWEMWAKDKKIPFELIDDYLYLCKKCSRLGERC